MYKCMYIFVRGAMSHSLLLSLVTALKFVPPSDHELYINNPFVCTYTYVPNYLCAYFKSFS